VGPGFQPPAQPTPAAPAQEPPGISHGVPLARRGQITIETAGFTDTSGEDSIVTVGLNVHMPIRKTTFLDARLPMASYFPGNIMLGADHIQQLDPKGFLIVGGQIGLPLVTQRALRAFSLPNGTWNMHEYQANFMPIKVVLGYERVLADVLALRLEVEPVLSMPIGDYGNDVGFALQHAAEIQWGHTFGGGFRVQGVFVTESLIDDLYQLSVEPFLVVRRELGFARLGLLLPIDDSTAGPPFEQAWGLRLWAGIHID
jgi:hypothetical protein